MARVTPATHPCFDVVGRVLAVLCRAFALAGGVILVAITMLTVVSVAGRSLAGAPVSGDFELVEIGMAVAVFAFLPYCQLRNGNVVVDVFTARLSRPIRDGLDAASHLAYTLIAGLLAWRLTAGGIDLFRVNDQTMVLGVPRFWAFFPIVVSSVLLTLVCAYTVWRSIDHARHG